MIEEGAQAPAFELPAYVDGEQRRVALEEFVGEDVVVLAFYPADFNPACDRESGLDELDLFTMQKDLTVLAVSPDSVYSHAAFATEYNLGIPLLADTRRRVAEAYGLRREDDLGQSLVERAVLVLDHEGVVEYRWHTSDLVELPNVNAVKEGVAGVGDDDTAQGRYRIGHAHYTEARRAFTSAMDAYEDSEWMLAQSDFHRAREEFDEATDHFDSAVRFADDADHAVYYEGAEEKASALWQSADWLAKSASAYASGDGSEGRALKDDAYRPLENARDIGDPVHPDDWPPEEDLTAVEATGTGPDAGTTDVAASDATAGEEPDRSAAIPTRVPTRTRSTSTTTRSRRSRRNWPPRAATPTETRSTRHPRAWSTRHRARPETRTRAASRRPVTAGPPTRTRPVPGRARTTPARATSTGRSTRTTSRPWRRSWPRTTSPDPTWGRIGRTASSQAPGTPPFSWRGTENRDMDRTAAARAYYAALDDGDYERLERLLAPDFRQERPDRTFEGRAAFVRFMREERPRTDTRHPIDAVYESRGPTEGGDDAAGPASGEAVAVEGRLVTADGERLARFVDVFDFAEDRIAALRTYTR